MAENKVKKVSYYNTLVFTIISGIISLLLLGLLFFNFAKDFKLGIIALEIGIFTVILVCIAQIIYNENFINKLKKNHNVRISFDSCPDYFTKLQDSHQKAYCSNEYIYEDEALNKFLIKVYPENQIPPSDHDPRSMDLLTESDKPAGPIDKFYIDELESKTKNKNSTDIYKDTCAPLFKDNYNNNGLVGYTELPWTTLRSKCDNY